MKIDKNDGASIPAPEGNCDNNESCAGAFRAALKADPGGVAKLRAELEGIALQNRFIPERDAREMQMLAGAVVMKSLPPSDIAACVLCGAGHGPAIVTLEGLLPLRYTPPTPVSGFCDDTHVAPADLALLGVFNLMGIEAVAYGFENFGRIFRNVVPASAGQVSSHGYDLELPYHTDNLCGWFEGAEHPVIDGVVGRRSPIPHFLGFVGLRNLDADGRPVATEILPVSLVLDQIHPDCLGVLCRPEFRLNPPQSNETSAMVGMPLVVRAGNNLLLRYMSGGDYIEALTPRAAVALQKLEDAIQAASPLAERVEVKPGMILVFDNYRVLHRRPKFEPGELREARWLRRCFGAQLLASGVFLDRYHRPNEWA